MRKVGWLLVAVVPTALVLTACGGGGGSGSMDSAEMAPAPAQDSVVTEKDREIIRNGDMSLRVDDVRASVESMSRIAIDAGGRIASESINATGEDFYANVTARVPAASLDAVMDQIGALGTVTSETVYAEDVTTQGVDLDARIAALETSIARLQQLLAQATTTKDLIEIESELTTRQAELDSLVAQRAALSEAVALSTLTVYLTPSSEAADWTPPGFLSGLESGWNALRTTVATLITVVGFALPFIAVAATLVVPIIVIVILLGRRKRSRS